MGTNLRPRLTAEPRERARKKSAVRALRRAGEVPGLLYGHGEPQTIQVSANALRDYLRHHSAGAILDLDLGGRITPTLIRELDRDRVTGKVIHLGLQRVDLGETVRATIPLLFVGEQALIDRHLVAQRQMSELEVQGRADLLPEAVTIDLSEAQAGDSIRIGDARLPAGVEPVQDPELPLATVTAPIVPADVAAALDLEEAKHEGVAGATSV